MNAPAFLVEYQEITGGRVHSLGLFIQNRDDLYREYLQELIDSYSDNLNAQR
ncbi:MAG: hypothetical protein OXH57_00395 [Ekhidna sp.]|nr:hypothetical protein [Ekhidna sp.]